MPTHLVNDLPAENEYMSEENDVLRITEDDIKEANQLSHSCPICASSVENYVTVAELAPVMCSKCGTLYHKACWQQNGGKCAILGCAHNEYRLYGREDAAITIGRSEIPSDAQVSRQNKHLKQIELERRRNGTLQDAESQGFWSSLFANIRRLFGN